MGTGGYIKVFKAFCITGHIEMSWVSLERINTISIQTWQNNHKRRVWCVWFFLKKQWSVFRMFLFSDCRKDTGLVLNCWMILLTDLCSYPDTYILT